MAPQFAPGRFDQKTVAIGRDLKLIGLNGRFFELLDFPERLGISDIRFSAFTRDNAGHANKGVETRGCPLDTAGIAAQTGRVPCGDLCGTMCGGKALYSVRFVGTSTEI